MGYGSPGPDVSLVIWKDTSEQALLDIARTTSLDWTDLDLTAFTSPGAKCAIVQLQFYIISITGGKAVLEVRKKGTTTTINDFIVAGAKQGDLAQAELEGVAIVGLDAGQTIEYKTTITDTININSMINVLGYIE
ncbi:unnamed protein product [marine sediment metagenome]|uniref:Uncharacterized protein n=1 Tax=marine sediment metagenome TaxID=412755 RepID=X1TRL2_9ZZZZ